MSALDWRKTFDLAYAELEANKCTTYVYMTEEAVFLRRLELQGDGIDRVDASVELAQMDIAMHKLNRLKTQRLGWPDPTGSNSQLHHD